MRSSYDLSKSKAVIDDYIQHISNPDELPGKHGRTWLEFLMQKHGLIPNVRNLAFGESHAIWYAALVVTKRLAEVSRIERDTHHAKASRTTSLTVNKMLAVKWNPLRDSLTAQLLREILQK